MSIIFLICSACKLSLFQDSYWENATKSFHQSVIQWVNFEQETCFCLLSYFSALTMTSMHNADVCITVYLSHLWPKPNPYVCVALPPCYVYLFWMLLHCLMANYSCILLRGTLLHTRILSCSTSFSYEADQLSEFRVTMQYFLWLYLSSLLLEYNIFRKHLAIPNHYVNCLPVFPFSWWTIKMCWKT